MLCLVGKPGDQKMAIGLPVDPPGLVWNVVQIVKSLVEWLNSNFIPFLGSAGLSDTPAIHSEKLQPNFVGIHETIMAH
jgi:hypothetical protein